jgi:hypothetical protein
VRVTNFPSLSCNADQIVEAHSWRADLWVCIWRTHLSRGEYVFMKSNRDMQPPELHGSRYFPDDIDRQWVAPPAAYTPNRSGYACVAYQTSHLPELYGGRYFHNDTDRQWIASPTQYMSHRPGYTCVACQIPSTTSHAVSWMYRTQEHPTIQNLSNTFSSDELHYKLHLDTAGFILEHKAYWTGFSANELVSDVDLASKYEARFVASSPGRKERNRCSSMERIAKIPERTGAPLIVNGSV